MAFFYYFDSTNYETLYRFLSTAKYIIFQCEIIIDDSLLTIGLTSKEYINKYLKDLNIYERIKMLKY